MKIKVPMNDTTYGAYWLEIEAKPVKIPELEPFQFALYPQPLAKTRKNYKPHTVCEVTTGACIYELLFGDRRGDNPSREIIKRYNTETRTIEGD